MAHTLTIRVSHPKQVSGGNETKIELSFRLPQWALTKLNEIEGVTVKAQRQNHVLFVVTPSWSVYREAVLDLIANANLNALVERTHNGTPGYNVRVTEEVLVLTTRSTDLTFETPKLTATA